MSRIAVALSGGVDSAVAAALLKEQGEDVFALTALLRQRDVPDEARRVAAALQIPFHVVDLRNRFEACVIEPFIESYLQGETPNPCVLCNRRIKFGDLMEEARAHGAEAFATGHYVRRMVVDGKAQLHRGADRHRDQSYFLFALLQEQIDFLRFPLGELTKDAVRSLAREKNLPCAQKPDSQDICFVPDGDYARVLETLRPGAAQSGDIVDQSGKVLGQHEGIIHFTVGQRRGLNLKDRKGDHNEPLFVLRLDEAKRQVIVGPREAVAQKDVFLRDMNWLGETCSEEGEVVSVRLRSTQEPALARFFPKGEKRGYIQFTNSTYGVSPGQAGVVYEARGCSVGDGLRPLFLNGYEIICRVHEKERSELEKQRGKEPFLLERLDEAAFSALCLPDFPQAGKRGSVAQR